MKLLRYAASKDDAPTNSLTLVRCHHGHLIGIDRRRGMRCTRWLWRTCR